MSLLFLHLTTKIQISVCFTPFSNSSISTMLILEASRTSVKYQLLYAEFVKAFFVVQLAEPMQNQNWFRLEFPMETMILFVLRSLNV